MSSDKIEGIAISTIKNEIWKTNRLSPFINDQDKEPSWDGAVYIYNNVSRKKDSLIGRVPVQVKGKIFNKKFPNKIRFKISVVDLRSYLNDGGAIYFVVYENHKTNENKIYYVELSPIRLKSMLPNIGKQKTLSIQLKSFPNKIESREDVLLNFYKNSQLQSSFGNENAKVPTFNELFNNGMANKIHLTKYSFAKRNLAEYMQNGEFYAYLESESNITNLPIPVEFNFTEIKFKQDIKANIHINGKTYYDSFKNDIDDENDVIKIGKGITFTLQKDKNCFNLNYENTKYLKDILYDYQFLYDLIENGGFSIGDCEFKINKKDIAANQEKIRFILETAKRYKGLLDFLNCKKDLDYTALTIEEHHTLDALYYSLIEKKSVYLNTKNDCAYGYCKISNLNIMLFAKKDKKDSEKYFVEDFFSDNVKRCFCIEKGKHINLPQYVFLTVDDLLTVDNLCLEKIMPCIKNFKKTDTLISFSLDLLEKLCEACKTSNDEVYLNIAKNLFEWLKTNERNYNFVSGKIQEILKKYKKFVLG